MSKATLFITRERAVATLSRIRVRKPRACGVVVPAEVMEADRSRSKGYIVRYREPMGAWQYA